MVGIGMGMAVGVILMSGMEEWEVSVTWTSMRASMKC